MNATRAIVGIVPVGKVRPEKAPEVIAAHIGAFFRLPADILSPIVCPMDAFDPGRLQYNAATIMTALEKHPPAGYLKIIGVLSEDLFVPIFTHVYGEARQGGICALVSTFRLEKSDQGPAPPPSLTLERTAKLALHELGHLFNLVHCDDQHCLMYFAGDLLDLDRIPFSFCRYCAAFRDQALHRLGNLDPAGQPPWNL